MRRGAAASFDRTNTCGASAALESVPDTARCPSAAQRPQQCPAGAPRLLTPHDGAIQPPTTQQQVQVSRPVHHHVATPVSPVVASPLASAFTSPSPRPSLIAVASPIAYHLRVAPPSSRLVSAQFAPRLRTRLVASMPAFPVTPRLCRCRLAAAPASLSPPPAPRLCVPFAGTAPPPPPPRWVRAGSASTPPRVASTPTSPSPRQSPPHAPRRRPTPALASASGSSAPDSRSICLHAAPLVSPSPHHSHPCPPRCHIAAPLASASGSPL